MSAQSHRERILDQFTRQATPFSTSPAIRDEAALTLAIEFCGVTANDTVLDVACGPGILACAFARVARHVTGIDITPAMLDKARALQREQGLTNLAWDHGDATPLPYGDGAFTVVTSRFAFHHFLDPKRVLAEMTRVCAPGGTVLVVDSAPAREKADRFNHMEKLRDPSHTRALPIEEHRSLFAAVGLPEPRVTWYRLQAELEGLITRSFPNPGDDVKLRKIFEAAAERDDLDMQVHRADGTIRLGYPVAVLAARKP
jgi:ubiquinone/menaquinone biosynthesis C-methylase UbiE